MNEIEIFETQVKKDCTEVLNDLFESFNTIIIYFDTLDFQTYKLTEMQLIVIRELQSREKAESITN